MNGYKILLRTNYIYRLFAAGKGNYLPYAICFKPHYNLQTFKTLD